GGGDGQVLRRLIRQVCAPKRALSRRLSIGSAGSASQAKRQRQARGHPLNRHRVRRRNRMANTLLSRRTEAQLHALAGVQREIGANDHNGRRKYLQDYTRAFRSYQSVIEFCTISYGAMIGRHFTNCSSLHASMRKPSMGSIVCRVKNCVRSACGIGMLLTKLGKSVKRIPTPRFWFCLVNRISLRDIFRVRLTNTCRVSERSQFSRTWMHSIGKPRGKSASMSRRYEWRMVWSAPSTQLRWRNTRITGST